MRSATSTTGDDTGTVSDDELPLLMLRALKAMMERLNEDEVARPRSSHRCTAW